MSDLQRNAGRAAMSVRFDEAAWLDQLLSTAARGGDLRVMMRSPLAARVQRIVGGAKERAAKTAHLRTGLRETAAARRKAVLEAFEPGFSFTKHDIVARTGLSLRMVEDVLARLSQSGILSANHSGRWERVSVVRDPLKAAAR